MRFTPVTQRCMTQLTDSAEMVYEECVVDYRNLLTRYQEYNQVSNRKL